MPELLLDGVNGRRLILFNPRKPDVDGIWSYRAALIFPNGKSEAEILDLGEGLAFFLRDLADAWTGFDGIREFTSLERQMSLSCQHDGIGTVYCMVILGQREPPTWELRVEIDFGSGAHLERIARDAAQFVAAAKGT